MVILVRSTTCVPPLEAGSQWSIACLRAGAAEVQEAGVLTERLHAHSAITHYAHARGWPSLRRARYARSQTTKLMLELGLLNSSLETDGLHAVLLTRLFDALAEQSAHREVRCKWVNGTCCAKIEGLSRKDNGHQH